MTISEALDRIDTLKPNSYSNSEKIKWISILDGIIYTEIICTHEGYEGIVFDGYTEETDSSTPLLVPAPYDDIYTFWLQAQIDYTNGEYNKYNNSMVAYDTSLDAYQKYYNKHHKPKSAGRFRF